MVGLTLEGARTLSINWEKVGRYKEWVEAAGLRM